MEIELIKEGLRIFLNRLKPYPTYKGDAEQICAQIVEKCWNGKYYQTGAYTYPEFWTRDFGFCAESLVKLGHKQNVYKTLEYALSHFKEQNRIGTHITQDGKVLDFPTYSVDSLPLLLHAIRVSGFNIKKYKIFINEQIKYFYEYAFDHNKGIILPNKHFSSMKDYFVKNSSCYDNCMTYMLCEDIEKLKLDNPFNKKELKKNIEKYFWNGHYFNEDLTNAEICGDANTFPFWCGVSNDKKKFESCLKYIQEEYLDFPVPLKYTKRNRFGQVKESIFVPFWEGNKLWMHLGLCYLDVVAKFDKKLCRDYLTIYKEIIEKYHNFLEVLEPSFKPYRSPFYKADHSMLWACKYLALSKGI